MRELETYLDQVCSRLRFGSAELRLELKQHIVQAARGLEAAGCAPEEAMTAAIKEFGDPAEVGAALAAAHRDGGPAMIRRVVLPAALAVGVWLAVTLIGAMEGYYSRWVMDRWVMGQTTAPWLPLVTSPLTLGWVVLPVVFLSVRMCAMRGGSRRECILVGLSPLVACSPFILYLAISVVASVAGGQPSPGLWVALQRYLQAVISTGGTCAAATWLYFFVARGVTERPFWLLAEQQR